MNDEQRWKQAQTMCEKWRNGDYANRKRRVVMEKLTPQEVVALQKENEALKAQLAEKTIKFKLAIKDISDEYDKLYKQVAEKDELLARAIVQEFRKGNMFYIIRALKKDIVTAKILSPYKTRIGGYEKFILVESKNNNQVRRFAYELYKTKAEAEEALRGLNEKN
jgi:MarR-like DNA-binding transcriptional regulator SgrR of sgrS sRNA